MNLLTYLAIIKIALIIALIFLAYIDFRTFQLPNAITIPMIITGIIFNGVGTTLGISLISPFSSLMGAITGFMLLWSLDAMYYWVKKQHGIGLGDAKLLSALGAWLGVGALPSILFMAAISGLLGGALWLRHQKQAFQSAFPFGPFLVFAGIIELLWPHYLQALLLNIPT
jgi:leader peptidase (prepilin peptidase)/N-methyltransferase